jgi:imidazolonepropionase-like amidohydrolase
MAELGAALNLPQSNQDKNNTVYERGLASLELAREAGVTLGFGTDLIGETQVRQGREFAIRAEVEPARDILRSMYLINPRLCMMEGEIGVLAPGSVGDMVLCKINPLENIALLANPADSLTLVLQSGMPVSGDSAS